MRKVCWAFCFGASLCLAGLVKGGGTQEAPTSLTRASSTRVSSTPSGGRDLVLASAAEVRHVLAPALANAGGKKGKKIEIKDDPDIVFVDTVKSADLPDLSGRVTDDPI